MVLDWPTVRRGPIANRGIFAALPAWQAAAMEASMDTAEPAIFRAAVSAEASAREVEAFRENFARAFLQLELDPLEGHRLQCEIAIRALPDLALGVGRCSPVRGHHPAALADNDDFVLVALTDGGTTHRQGPGSFTLHAGEAVLTRAAETNTFTGHAMTRVVNMRFSRERMERLLVSPDDVVGRPIPQKSLALRLLFSQCEILIDPHLTAEPETLRSAAASSYDLMALALGNSRDPRAHAGGVRAARLQAVRSDMARRFREPLSIGGVARRHGISASYLRQLFAETRSSFADHLLALRLAAVHRALAAPHTAGLNISDIAYDAGFGDLSYFNRAFRQRYGMTPSEVRAAARER